MCIRDSREGIKHQVLNAKHHEKEAHIVAQAGKPYAVTIATNMAGRGTDIMLGGNPEYMARDDLSKSGMSEELLSEATGYAETQDPEVLDARAQFAEKLKKYRAETEKDAEFVRQAGGLYILGTERHESRRIDNQLRGRAGRQGDPGESAFYLSLEDDLMRLFGSERIHSLMETLRMPDDEPIDQRMLSAICRAIRQSAARPKGSWCARLTRWAARWAAQPTRRPFSSVCSTAARVRRFFRRARKMTAWLTAA